MWEYANTVQKMVAVVLFVMRETEVMGFAAAMGGSHDQKQGDLLHVACYVHRNTQLTENGFNGLWTHIASGPAAERLGGCVGKGISLAKSNSLLLADEFAVFGGALRLIVAADAPFWSSYTVVVRRSCVALGPSWLSGEDAAAVCKTHIRSVKI